MPSLAQLFCAAWGHHVDNHRFHEATGSERRCRCGARYLEKHGQATRVGHTLSCFLGHHTYQRLIDRDGCHEYVCVQCGHPLLFAADSDPYASAARFDKKVRYLCGLFGHRVRPVTARDGFVEYACFCGHTFLRPAHDLSVIRHPAVCVLAGHWITFVTERAGFSEYVCRNCGHPFCFAEPERPVTVVAA
jgi:DNA-directed RNA polymerase subunit RPC12/RpoP